MYKFAPFSIKSLAIVIAGDSLVSFVFDLNAKPNKAHFLDVTVPKKFQLLILRFFSFCHSK